jgi:hypothetical protein
MKSKKVLLISPDWKLIKENLSEQSYYPLTVIKFPILVDLEEGFQNVIKISFGYQPLWNLDWFNFKFVEDLTLKYLL